MSWKVIWQALKNQDMRKRVLAVIAMLLVFRLLAHIPIPLADGAVLRQVLDNVFTSAKTPQLLSFIDILSGGALASLSVMLVGLGPYINASIILQLLTKAIPKLETLNKEGEFGRRKINQYTRMLTFPLAIVQSIGAIYLVRQYVLRVGGVGDITAGAGIMQWALMVAALTGGAMLLMWLGELITEQSVGNGISLLITVGIVSSLPGIIGELIRLSIDEKDKITIIGKQLPLNKTGLIFGVATVTFGLLLTYIIVKLNEAHRKITINYAKRVQGNKAYGGVTTTLPIKLITAGVIPIIFATAFLSVPAFAGQLLSTASSDKWRELGANLTNWFQASTSQTLLQPGMQKYLYPVVYFGLVVLFTYFYTSVTFNSKEISENLQKQGGFVEGVRPGAETQRYLSSIVNRLMLFGSLSLGMLALLPTLVQIFVINVFPTFNASLVDQINVGGTSVLILVSVALETLRQIESRALMVTYDFYEQPDFFAPAEGLGTTAVGARRFAFLPRLKRKNKK